MFDLYLSTGANSLEWYPPGVLDNNHLLFSYATTKKWIIDYIRRKEAMSIDLYLAGGKVPPVEPFLTEHRCNRLCSQIYDRKNYLEWAERVRESQGKLNNKLFIDSGAYTAYTRQKEIDVDEYIEFVNSIDDFVTVFAQVDKIPGVHGQPKTKEQILEAPELSWKNYLYMRERVTSPDKLLPIFHRREDFKWLKQMLETTFDGKHIPYIGIAATTDSSVKEKKEWFERVFAIIRSSSNPNVKTHAFGMTSLKLLETYPFTSADSTSWLMAGANGGIMSKWGTIIVSEQQKNDPSHILHATREQADEIHNYIESFGFTLEQLSQDYKNRVMFNALFLKEWAKNYKLKSTDSYKKPLF